MPALADRNIVLNQVSAASFVGGLGDNKCSMKLGSPSGELNPVPF
jgi:hypothetical protein